MNELNKLIGIAERQLKSEGWNQSNDSLIATINKITQNFDELIAKELTSCHGQVQQKKEQ